MFIGLFDLDGTLVEARGRHGNAYLEKEDFENGCVTAKPNLKFLLDYFNKDGSSCYLVTRSPGNLDGRFGDQAGKKLAAVGQEYNLPQDRRYTIEQKTSMDLTRESRQYACSKAPLFKAAMDDAKKKFGDDCMFFAVDDDHHEIKCVSSLKDSYNITTIGFQEESLAQMLKSIEENEDIPLDQIDGIINLTKEQYRKPHDVSDYVVGNLCQVVDIVENVKNNPPKV